MGAPTFTNDKFRRSHGSNPRGRGQWAFQRARTLQAFESDMVGDVVFAPIDMTLTEARRWVMDHEACGTGVWAVMP